jgi:hypothetical protein
MAMKGTMVQYACRPHTRSLRLPTRSGERVAEGGVFSCCSKYLTPPPTS